MQKFSSRSAYIENTLRELPYILGEESYSFIITRRTPSLSLPT